jgi:hypothetical protein
MRVPSRISRFVCQAAVAGALIAVVVSAGAARAATSEFTRIGASAAVEAESVPTLPDLTALKSAANTEFSKWRDSRPLMLQMFKQRELASKTTPDRRMLYLINQTTPEPLGDLQFWTAQLIGFQDTHYGGIWIGQPDASNAQITPVAARRIFASNDLDGAEPAFARYATSLSAEMTLVEALQKSLARYRGADADENGAWALVHARAIRDYASALAAQLDQTVASMQLMRFVFDSDPRPIDAQIAVLKEWRDRVAADGEFSLEELREAANLGLSQNQLVGMKLNLLADDWNLSRASVVAHMGELLAAHAALKPTLLALANDMSPLIAELEADPLVPDLAPVANAGGPYSGAQGATISFNAGASTSPSAITAYEWDLDGDGAFDDATGVNPTSFFSTIRDSTVGLRVTNATGDQDVGYARLEVTAGSGGGVMLDSFSPFRVGSQFIGEAAVRLGETQAFSVTASNANHYIWQLDYLFTVASGVPIYALTPTTAQIGPHVLKVIVTAGANASVAIKWDVAVLAPDGDGDRWNANADCDDADASVHPLRNEVIGNGKDDDCDPATPDVNTNTPPVATDVSLTTAEDTPIGVTLTGTDADGNPVSGGPTSEPAHGGFVDGVYTPDANFNGTDSFTFLVTDGHGGTDSGTVTITVTPVNDPPVAVADSYATNQEGVLFLDAPGVLANDTDVEGDALEAQLVDAPTVVLQFFALQADGSIQLVPRGAFEGTVTFTYRTVDAGGAASDPATVTISVKAVNHPPRLTHLLVPTDEDTPLTLLGMSALDPDGDALTITTTQPSHGSYVGGLNGVYTPDANYNGPDSFTYTADDGRGGTATATVDLVVRPVNDPPEWEVAPPSLVTIAPDSVQTFDVVGRDIDGSDISFGATTAGCDNPAEKFGPNFHFDTEFFPSQGTVLDAGVPRREGSTLTIHTKFGATIGTYCLKLVLAENGSSIVRELTIVVSTGRPSALPDSYATDEDVPVTQPAPGVLANDLDAVNAPLTAELASLAGHGDVSLAANGSFVYTPHGDFYGTDWFTYRARDVNGNLSIPATATITVKATNDPPVASDQAVATDEDTPLAIALAGTDVDGDTVAITTTSAAHGTFAGGVYTPAANYHGADSFTYTVSDGHGGSDTATVTITVRPANDPPTVADRAVTTAQDTPVAVGLIGTDIDGDTLTFTFSTPFHGTHDGTTYTPAAGYSGPDLFTYTASDGHGGSATAVVSITVTPANPPTDTTPPSCEIVEQGKTAAGNPFIRFRVTEVGLGLARHEPGYLLNTSVLVEPYAVGSLGPVTVTATAVNKRKSMAVEVFFYDLAGNRALCDPIVMSVQRLTGKPQDEVLRNVPDTDHRVTVTNGAPGMRKVVLLVNGKYFGQHRLKAGQVRKFSVGTAMKPGYVNTIRVRASGPKGAKATILIANIP